MNKHLIRELNEKAATMARAMDDTYNKNEKLHSDIYAFTIRAEAAEKNGWKATEKAQIEHMKCERIFWCCALIGIANILVVSLALFLTLAR